MRRFLLRAVVVLVLAGLGGGAWWALRPQPVPVDLVPVERADLELWIEEEGRARVRDIYTVAAPLAGHLQRVPLDVGDEVAAGRTIVARITPGEPALMDVRTRLESEAAVAAAHAALDMAEVAVRRAAAEHEFARAEMNRTDRLVERGVMPAKVRDQAVLTTELAASAVSAAEAEREVRARELERAEARLTAPERDRGADDAGDPAEGCCVVLRAPTSGRVLRVVQESETEVAPGTPLVEIGDPGHLEFTVDLLTNDAVALPDGARAEIVDWGGAPLAGRLDSIEPIARTEVSALGIEEQRVTAVVAIEADPASYGMLGHGYGATVRLRAWRAEDRLAVPVGSLFRRGSEWAAFREREGAAEMVTLEVGRMDGTRAEVLAGLDAGDRVVAFPGDRVEAGIEIVPREDEALGGPTATLALSGVDADPENDEL